jgi:hypothetical protein
LPNDAAAREEALHIIYDLKKNIIYDLKKNNVTGWNGWRVEVMDGGRLVWQIPFSGAE